MVTELFSIRIAQMDDRDAIRLVHSLAFPTPAEAALVDNLERAQTVCASVVALSESSVLGHALFSTASIELAATSLRVGALGPVGVRPNWQGRGVGAALIRAGLERCWQLQLPAVIVLGHPAYYPRFGFQRADTWGIRCEFAVPPAAFMIAWSVPPIFGPGIAKYQPAFGAV
jgi:putative acetyltransferase